MSADRRADRYNDLNTRSGKDEWWYEAEASEALSNDANAVPQLWECLGSHTFSPSLIAGAKEKEEEKESEGSVQL